MKLSKQETEKTIFRSDIYLGENNGERIYLSAPSWDCDWYWGFGYLGNKNCHYHVEGLKKIGEYNHEKRTFEYEFVNLYDGIKKHFGDTFIIKNDEDIWKFAELMATFYTLREYSDTICRGGSHYTLNPIREEIKNEDEYKRINTEVLPSLFNEVYILLKKYQ